MPHYEFFCHACKKTFSKSLTIAKHEKETSSVRTAVARMSNRAGLPSPPSLRRRAPEADWVENGLAVPGSHSRETAIATAKGWQRREHQPPR